MTMSWLENLKLVQLSPHILRDHYHGYDIFRQIYMHQLSPIRSVYIIVYIPNVTLNSIL